MTLLPRCAACGASLWDHDLAVAATVVVLPVVVDGIVVGYWLGHPVCGREPRSKERRDHA
jgi:hypothetical protein